MVDLKRAVAGSPGPSVNPGIPQILDRGSVQTTRRKFPTEPSYSVMGGYISARHLHSLAIFRSPQWLLRPGYEKPSQNPGAGNIINWFGAKLGHNRYLSNPKAPRSYSLDDAVSTNGRHRAQPRGKRQRIGTFTPNNNTTSQTHFLILPQRPAQGESVNEKKEVCVRRSRSKTRLCTKIKNCTDDVGLVQRFPTAMCNAAVANAGLWLS